MAWLQALDAQPGVRTLLIRRPGSMASQERRRLIVAETPADPCQRRLVELDVELDALPSLDLDALVAAAPPEPRLAQVWLVCTHGTRDRCCAKWGMPVFEALRQREADPGRVWQSSHLGGHRFAATFLSLPDGLMWGRFDLAELDTLRGALGQGQLATLGSLRGRCCHPRSVQAAEVAVREREGLVDDAALVLLDHAPTPAGGTAVRFVGPDGATRTLEVERQVMEFEAPPSCGDVPSRQHALTVLPTQV